MAGKRDVWILAEALENIGDFALLSQAIHALRANPRTGEIAVRQWAPPTAHVIEELARQGVGIVNARRLAGFRADRRLLLFAGGQVIRDNASPASMVALWITLHASRWGGGRQAAMAIGASELTSRFHRAVWRRVLSSFEFITCRDGVSLERVRTLCGTTRLELTDDLVFLPSPLHDRLSLPAPAHHILLAPCDDPGEGRLLDPKAVKRIVSEAGRQCPAADTLVLCHDPRPRMDLAIASRIAGVLGEARFGQVRVRAASALDETLDRYRECSAVVTNRLHAMIFGILAGKPVFIVGDGNSKVEGFARRFDVPVIPQAGLSGEALAAAVAAGLGESLMGRRSEELARAKAAAARNLELLETII